MTLGKNSQTFALAGLLAAVGAACSGDARSFGAGGAPEAGGSQGQTGGAVNTGGRAPGTGGQSYTGGAAGSGGRAGAGGGTSGSGGVASGSGGVASGGAAGSTGGVAGSSGSGPLDAGSGDTPIQRVQDGTLAIGARVTVERVFVTAGRQTPNGGFSFFLQEPEGMTTGGHSYPAYAGLGGIIRPTDAAAFPAVSDCIDATGAIIDFRGLTEIDVSSWKLAVGSCGAFPQPFVIPSTTVGLDDIATDTDTAVAGLQPGALAERYEGVLIQVNDVSALAAPDANGVFMVSPVSGNPAGRPALQIDDFFHAEVPAAGQHYTSITGVLSDFDRYILQPRSGADVVR